MINWRNDDLWIIHHRQVLKQTAVSHSCHLFNVITRKIRGRATFIHLSHHFPKTSESESLQDHSNYHEINQTSWCLEKIADSKLTPRFFFRLWPWHAVWRHHNTHSTKPLYHSHLWNMNTALIESHYKPIFTATSLKEESCAYTFNNSYRFGKEKNAAANSGISE